MGRTGIFKAGGEPKKSDRKIRQSTTGRNCPSICNEIRPTKKNGMYRMRASRHGLPNLARRYPPVAALSMLAQRNPFRGASMGTLPRRSILSSKISAIWRRRRDSNPRCKHLIINRLEFSLLSKNHATNHVEFFTSKTCSCSRQSAACHTIEFTVRFQSSARPSPRGLQATQPYQGALISTDAPIGASCHHSSIGVPLGRCRLIFARREAKLS